mmetsp:Transcript_18238/g.42487  ORF Transcript_18238/g.42487 Transcript_18238/m.42487 type:complete len:99 (+) Transcript_18238:48-344(+)
MPAGGRAGQLEFAPPHMPPPYIGSYNAARAVGQQYEAPAVGSSWLASEMSTAHSQPPKAMSSMSHSLKGRLEEIRSERQDAEQELARILAHLKERAIP